MNQRTAHIGKLSANEAALYINAVNEPLKISIFPEATLGRMSASAATRLTVDLTAYAGYEKGVSRLHAMIRRIASGDVVVIDQGSANGSFINGTRLLPFTPTRLKSGDTLRLAQLHIEIYFGEEQSAVSPAKSPGEEVFSLHRDPAGVLTDRDTLPVPSVTLDEPVVPKPLVTHILGQEEAKPPATTQFQGTLVLDQQQLRSQSDVMQSSLFAENFLRHLKNLPGCTINLTLEINVNDAKGFDSATLNEINALSQELKFTRSSFTAP